MTLFAWFQTNIHLIIINSKNESTMKRCYFLAAMMMATLGLQAQREKPVPLGTTELQTSENTGGQLYYLYSKAGEFFYTSGNEWGSQASQGTTGRQVYFRQFLDTGETEWDGKRYVIRNHVSDTKGWDDVFIIDNYLVNDCSGRGNNVWSAEWDGDEVRFYAAKFSTSAFDEDTYGQRVYIGYVPGDGGTTLQPTGVVASAEPVNWTLVKASDYDQWLADTELYGQAENLRAAIEEANAACPGIDLSQVEAIYNDTGSSLEALAGAQEEVKVAVKAYLAAHADTSEPINATLLVVNPDYGKSNSSEGWSGTPMTVSDGCAELFDLTEFDTYQDITGLPNGIYKLNLHGLFRMTNCDDRKYYSADGKNLQPEELKARLYGRSGDVTSDVRLMDILDGLSSTKIHDQDVECAPGKWAPNRRASFSRYNEEGYYADNTVYVPVVDGTLRIGLMAKDIKPRYSWCVFDDWSLGYCGNTPAAYDAWRGDFLGKWEVADGILAQASLVDSFREAEEAVGSATTLEELTSQYQKMRDLYPQVLQSARDYEAFVKAMTTLRETLAATSMTPSEPLTLLEDYLNENLAPGDVYARGTYEYIIENCLLGQAELQAEQAYADSLYICAKKLDVKEGTDVTELLVNASMKETDFQGWNPTAPITQDFNSGMGEADFPVAQAFNTKFELSQEVTDIPDGLYRLELNGLYRAENTESKEEAPVVLYINDFESPVKNINTDAIPVDLAEDSVNCLITNPGTHPYDNITEGGYVPNSVSGCSFAFKSGRYKQTVYGLVTGGKMTVGLRDPREVSVARGWTVFTNFRLTYMARNMEAMDEVLQSLQERVDEMDENGQFCYAGARANAQDIISKGLATTDAGEKYAILGQANEYMKELSASVAVYNELATVLDMVNDAYWDAAQKVGQLLPGATDINDTASWTPEYKAADDFAVHTYDVVSANIYDGKYTNEEAEALAKQLRLTPIVDVIYVLGDLKDAPSWNENSGLYPLTRQADGTYQGTFTGLDRHADAGYGNRDMVFFKYQGLEVDCANEHPRWITPARNVVGLRAMTAASQYMAVYGGTWKVTVNAERTQATFEPQGDVLLPDYCYVVGSLKGDNWTANKNHPLVHTGDGKYYGEFEIEAGGKDDVTLFAGGWSMVNNNLTEARIGTSASPDTLRAEAYGQVIAGCDRFYGEPRWVLEPGRFSILFDAVAMTVTFNKLEGEVDEDGTAGKPFRVHDLYDLVALRQHIQPGRMNHVTLEQDIDMSTVKTWAPLNQGSDMVGDRGFMNWIDFDGQNHVIHGFTSTEGSYSSFFGVLCGAVRNVGFPAADVTCTATGSGVLGGYVGHGNFKVDGALQPTAVENVWAEGKLHVASGYCGGLFGNIGGPTSIKNCYARLDITVDNEETITGGIVGRVSADVNMENVYAAGSVTGTAVTAGVVGDANASYEGGSTYRNVCVWNNTEQMFGTVKDNDVVEGVLYYDGQNFQDLQKAVVAWDPNVWSCTMEEGAYPVLKNVTGTGIGSVAGGTGAPRTGGAIYNLSGQRVEKMWKGIYIQNGRKVLVK